MITMAMIFPVGLFWFGWASTPTPGQRKVVAGIPIGSSIFVIWLQGLNYLVDIYLMFANSVLPANTLIDFIHLGWVYGSIYGCLFIKETKRVHNIVRLSNTWNEFSDSPGEGLLARARQAVFGRDCLYPSSCEGR